ncbi:unnamed protein product [Parascedosporium putredinis]|uniref:Uncharacterized protein n=1 Tax=Parascedosporium putredinis TaxID=1442378 RepID=A0A9P1H004_9PEZI|nr:unnamed protein product [Parascedosporium putredinis]CAI7991647.1 unnamed protein product [Parascedosporium putredinis]
MANTKPTLTRFKDAMRQVYGSFDDLTAEEATNWTPPETPGAGGHRGRYLWTDAFGVLNFLTLYKESGQLLYVELAKSLVRTVHDVLGRTRDGTARLPGASNETPLKGGLRIGKVDADGRDGDGQYHHYLTLWMFALNRLAVCTGDEKFNNLAIQLAKAIHPHFVYTTVSRSLCMVWKVSTDLKRVLVASEGHLDAATGYVVYSLLQRTAGRLNYSFVPHSLTTEINEYWQMMNRKEKRTMSPSSDTLDLGMGLWMCHLAGNELWANTLGEESLSLAHRVLNPERGFTSRAAGRRLAFREFGFCLGIQTYGRDRFLAHKVEDVLQFWNEHSETFSDDDLGPISSVMYAAALKPGAFYVRPPGSRRNS